jgi:PKD repeat protein
MRPFHGMVLTLAALAVGCGDDGGNGPANTPPTANFEPPACNLLSCTFTDASSDADGSIASRSWTFESGTPAQSSEANPTVSFAAAGTYTVTLSVTDNEGASDSFEREVTVSATPANQPPVADFDVECNALDCSFTSTSSDPDGTIATYAWNFGEPASPNNTSTEQNPTHTYSATAVTDFTVTLTVTDDDGAQQTTTQTFTVTPPASLQCESGAVLVNCTLNLTSKATLKLTLTSRSCLFTGNRLTITAPVQHVVFENGCSEPIGQEYPIPGPNPDGSFAAGTQIQAEFTQGAGDPDDPPHGPPAIRVDGTFPTWTINIDDGGQVGLPGEPDFNDIVLTAQATVVP